MKTSQIALQLYTLRDHLQTPADIAATLKKVSAIGYQAVQISGMGPIPETELLAICQSEGLAICGTHEPGARILDHAETVAERLHKLGCTQTAFPYTGNLNMADPEVVRTLIRKLDAAGKILRREGCQLSFHNHAIEFMRRDGRTILQQIYDETDPRHLQAELDTYWVQYGGGDPATWCRRMAGRLPWLHCKDYAFTPENKPCYAEVGSGNLDWPAIMAEAKCAGCHWFIVEQDDCPRDPFACVSQSLAYLKANFCAENS